MRCSNEADTEDLTAEVLYQIWRDRKTYRGEAAFRSWVYNIAHKKFINLKRWQRCKGNFVSLNDFNEFNNPDELLLPDHMHAVIAQANIDNIYASIETLSKVRRKVIKLRAADMSYDEIMQETGLSLNAVKSGLCYAKRDLRGMHPELNF